MTTAARALDDILDGDLTVALGQVTPLGGVVLTPVNTFGWNGETGTLLFTSSLAGYRKLERLERNPKVAVVFHTRQHGTATGEDYLLVHGDASFSWQPDRDRLRQLLDRPGLELGPTALGGGLWDRWLDQFWFERVIIEVAVRRIVAYPDAACAGNPVVQGEALVADLPQPQRIPAKGSGPRVTVGVADYDHRLLGWVGADGYPDVVPVASTSSNNGVLHPAVPAGLVPPGGRRAGLTAHSFAAGTLGQRQAIVTGWLENTDGAITYAPHTRLVYNAPPNRLLWRVGLGAVTRIGLERARLAGVPSLRRRDVRHAVVTPFQRHVANPVGRRVARYLNSQVVLETIGRKSGLPRQTPLGGRRRGSSYWIVSEFGRKSQYVQNILADPAVRLQIRGRWHTGTAFIVDDDDPRARLRDLPWLNSLLVRSVGSELLTIRVDLD